jgi:hypothetical protein
VSSRARKRVELVKKKNAGLLAGELENLSNVRGGLAQIGRNKPVELHHEERQTEFVREHLGAHRLSAAGWSAKQQL